MLLSSKMLVKSCVNRWCQSGGSYQSLQSSATHWTNVTDEKIESCHRLNKNTDGAIVKFLRRKDWDQFMRVKSELKKLKPVEFDLAVGTKLCINESLCPYYSGLVEPVQDIME